MKKNKYIFTNNECLSLNVSRGIYFDIQYHYIMNIVLVNKFSTYQFAILKINYLNYINLIGCRFHNLQAILFNTFLYFYHIL